MFADEAATLFERAITTTMKTNMLMYFTYADFEEVSILCTEVYIKWSPF